MEEYIKLHAEKAQRRGQMFNWETATYGKIYYDDYHLLTGFEADFPAIVYNDALTSNHDISPKQTASIYNAIKTDFYFNISFSDSDDDDYTFIYDKDSFSYKLILVNDWKSESVNDHVEINTESCSENIDIKPMDSMRHALTDRLRMVYTRAEGHVLFTIDTWRRLFKIWGPLVCRARRSMTWRVVPSYTSIRDPLMRLCHRLITVSISGRGQAPEKLTATDLFYLRSMDEGTAVDVPYLLAQYLIRHDEGRKRGARLSSKYFVGCLVEHFGLVTEEGLQGLIVVVGELRMVGIDELVRLRICKRFGDTLAWVASGLERQQVAVAGAPEDVEGAHTEVESVQADPVPVQAPEPPPAAAQSRTMPQKMAIVEKEVHGIRESLDEQCEVVDTMTRDFSKFNV
ncbi:hypothetical protein Tco_1284983 [Tanacetum coccineum]